MPVFIKRIKHCDLNQYIFQHTFLDFPSPHIYIVVNLFLATCLVGSNIIDQHTCILTNNAHELTPYRLEFKFDTSRIRKYFLSVLKFEHEFLG
jgi:hypothetical protein